MQQADPHLGNYAGNYRLVERIGAGGMGAVYVGVHKFLGDRAAIKLLHSRFSMDPVVAERFFREAKAERAIDHPNIVRILDFGQSDDGALYLVMELLEGQSLAARLDGKTAIDPGEVIDIGISVADGLAAAHALGIVHRDLKPANIFLSKKGVKIVDFGITKIVGDGTVTETGAIVGTPRYMAPEQARGDRDIGAPADVYSLGAVLYEMLAGRPVFEATTITGYLTKAIAEDPVPLSPASGVSPELGALVLSCLAKDPLSRPRSMAELCERLEALARQGATVLQWSRARARAQLPTVGSGVPEAATAGGPGEAQTRSLAPSKSSTSTGWMAAAVALVVVGGVAAGAIQRLSPRQPVAAVAAPNPPGTAAAGTASEAPAATAAPTPAAGPRIVRNDALYSAQLVSVPAGAEVSDENGTLVGITPMAVMLPGPARMTFSKRGYRDATVEVKGPGEVRVKLVAAAAPPSSRSPGSRKSAKPTIGLD